MLTSWVNQFRGGGGGGGSTSFTLTNTFTARGETFTLNKNAKVGTTLNGQPFIVSDSSGLTWVSSTTPSAPVLISGTNYQSHGAEFDPWWVSAGSGVDGDTASYSGTQGVSEFWGTLVSRAATYSSAKNIDPGATGTPYAIAQGACGRLVKTIQRSGLVAGNLTIPAKLIHVNIVPTVPPAGAIAPIYNGAGGVEWLTVFNKNVFRGSGYVASQTTLANCIAGGYLPDTDWPFYIANGEQRRGIIPYSSLWTSGYARDFGKYLSITMNACHAEGAAGVSDAVAYYLATLGCMFIENVRRGNVQRGGAGQNVGMKPLAALVGMASGSTIIMNQSQIYEGGETHQQFYIDNTFLGNASEFPGGNATAYNNRKTFTSDDIGRSTFFHGGQALPPSPSVDTALYDASQAVRYQYTAGQAGSLGFAAIIQLMNGPGGITGQQYALQGGSTDPAVNPYAACLTYWKEYATAIDDADVAVQAFEQTWHRTLLSTALTNYATPKTQTPAGVSPILNQSSYASAIAGGIQWDWRNIGFNTETITQYDNRYTLDGGRTFLVENNVASFGSKTTGIPVGIAIGLQQRRRSASGTGPWSVNFPKTSASGTQPGDRLVLTPTGTQSGAGVNTQLPQIMVRPYAWLGPYFTELSTPAAQNQQLFAGVGWWSNVNGAFTYKWYTCDSAGANRVAISGATNDNFTVLAEQAGGYICLGVTNGGVEAFSPAYQTAALAFPSFNAVTFDGANDYLTRNALFTGTPGNSQFLTIAIAVNFNAASDGLVQCLFRWGDSTAATGSSNNLIIVDRAATTNKITVTLRDAANIQVYTGTTTGTVTSADGEVRLLISVDLLNGTATCWKVPLNTDTGAVNMGLTGATGNAYGLSAIKRPFIGAALTLGGKLNGTLRYVYMNPTYIDFGIQANRDKTLTSNIGGQGAGISGSQALVMLYGAASDWNAGTNYGSGGNFTMVGAVT